MKTSPNSKTRRTTLRDVAEASGVSQSTVSFVLNEVPNQTISPATRERVRDAARDLGYVPNGIARALMEGTSRIVVLNIGRHHEGNYSRRFIKGLDKELALNGFVLYVRHGHTTPGDIKQSLDVISPRAVLNFAHVYVDGHELEDSGGGWKNGLAAHVLLQFRYLVEERGHSQIAVALPPDEPLADIRVKFANEVAGMLEIPAPIAFLVPEEPGDACAAIQEIRDSYPNVTAIAAFDDLTALRALAAMRTLDLSAPNDLAVIGYDQNEYAAIFTPTLTTLWADAEGHGRVAARRALGLDADDVQTHFGRVIKRESA